MIARRSNMQVKELAAADSIQNALNWLTSRLCATPLELRIILLTLCFGYITHGFVYANTLLGHDNILLYNLSFSSLRWAAFLFYSVRAFLQ